MSATYLGSYSDRLWNVRSLNQGVYIPGSCTLQTATGPQFFPVCSVNANLDQRRKLTMADYADGKYLGATDEHTALGTQKYHGLLLSVQRRLVNGFSVSANYTLSKCNGHPNQVLPNVNSGYVNPDDIDFDYGAVRFRSAASVQSDGKRRDAAVRATPSCARWHRTGACRACSAPTRGLRSSVTVTGDPARTGIGGQRANQVLDDPYGEHTIEHLPEPCRVCLASRRHAG